MPDSQTGFTGTWRAAILYILWNLKYSYNSFLFYGGSFDFTVIIAGY
jgi:hypothetical protein